MYHPNMKKINFSNFHFTLIIVVSLIFNFKKGNAQLSSIAKQNKTMNFRSGEIKSNGKPFLSNELKDNQLEIFQNVENAKSDFLKEDTKVDTAYQRINTTKMKYFEKDDIWYSAKYLENEELKELDIIYTQKDINMEEEYFLISNKPVFLKVKGTYRDDKKVPHLTAYIFYLKDNKVAVAYMQEAIGVGGEMMFDKIDETEIEGNLDEYVKKYFDKIELYKNELAKNGYIQRD